MLLPEIISIRSERGLTASMGVAARRDRMTMAEWVRRKLRQALVDEGLELPPFGEDGRPEMNSRIRDGLGWR
jgi:hypothetical protein